MTNPEVVFYTNISSPAMTENGVDLINANELDNRHYLTENQSITITGDVSGTGKTAIELTLATTGISAGTYNTVTVDNKGRVLQGAVTSLYYNLVTINSNYTATMNNDIILADGKITITLPSATGATAGKAIIIKRISNAGPVSIVCVNGQTIDGYSVVLIDQQNSSTTIVSNGTNWWII